jgi:DNA-binding transcriptional LysR family regulator
MSFRQHPLVSLTIRLGDQLTDLYRHPVDLAVRYGKPEDSSLVALPLDDDHRRVLCGSPDYFARHGRPVVPADLAGHNCLRYALVRGSRIY